MLENPLSGPESLGEFNGRTVSRVLYYHARNVLAGITYANEPRRVLEIVGGYGEIARLWVTNAIAPAKSYVIVDIPECLFFAEVALRSEFGEEVGYFEPGIKQQIDSAFADTSLRSNHCFLLSRKPGVHLCVPATEIASLRPQ
jgi:hypothetical protein